MDNSIKNETQQGGMIRLQNGHLFRIKQAIMGRYLGVVCGIVLIIALLSITQPEFLTWSNWQNIFRSQAIVFILAIGMTFVVISGGIDLSVGSMLTAVAMVLGIVIQHDFPWLLAIIITITSGALMGWLNGILIGKARISFFVVTLGTLSIYQSFALLSTNGQTISLFTFSNFENIQFGVNNNIGFIPTLLIVEIVFGLLAWFVLKYTKFGRSLYAVGSNSEAARLTGINTTRILIIVYTISGLFAGIAGVIYGARLTASVPIADPNIMLTVIAAVLIGGTSYTGGEGGILGTALGVLFLGLIQNGLSLSSISTFWQGTITGVILISAIAISVIRSQGFFQKKSI